MILVDTSVWVDHLRAGDARLADLLNRGQVLAHPWVAGELALGPLGQRDVVLRLLAGLPQAVVATAPEVAAFIETHRLYGLRIGYVDVQLGTPRPYRCIPTAQDIPYRRGVVGPDRDGPQPGTLV
jgi:predicted nucleic acid-binding protein